MVLAKDWRSQAARNPTMTQRPDRFFKVLSAGAAIARTDEIAEATLRLAIHLF